MDILHYTKKRRIRTENTSDSLHQRNRKNQNQRNRKKIHLTNLV